MNISLCIICTVVGISRLVLSQMLCLLSNSSKDQVMLLNKNQEFVSKQHTIDSVKTFDVIILTCFIFFFKTLLSKVSECIIENSLQAVNYLFAASM